MIIKNNKEKIMIVGPIPPPIGGIALYVKKLLNSKIINKEYNLIIFNTSIPSKVRRYEKRNERSYNSFLSDGLLPGVKLIKYVLFSFIYYYQKLISNRPKMIHLFTNSYWGFWRSTFYLLIARALGIKVIFHLLNAIDDFWIASGSIAKKIIQIVLKNSELLIVQSENIKKFVKSISDTPCSVIYNGVDSDITVKHSNINDEIINLIFIGSLTKNKGVFDIIDAASKLPNKKYMFTFIGVGPVQEFLNYSENLGIKKITNFHGTVSHTEKIKLLRESHIMLLPSYAEGQPVSILEGMAAGLPVISTKVGSIHEIIIDDINGFTIEPGNTHKLYEKIVELSTNKTLYNKISKNNLDDVKNKYRLDRVFNEILGNYKIVIK